MPQVAAAAAAPTELFQLMKLQLAVAVPVEVAMLQVASCRLPVAGCTLPVGLAEAATSHRQRLSVHIKVRDGYEKSPKRIAKQPQNALETGHAEFETRNISGEKLNSNYPVKTQPLY